MSPYVLLWIYQYKWEFGKVEQHFVLNWKSEFSTMLGRGHIEKQNHQWKEQKCGKHDTKQTVEVTLAHSLTAETRRQSMSLLSSTKNMDGAQFQFLAPLPMSVNNHKCTARAILGIQISLCK